MLSHLDGFQRSLRALQGLGESTVNAYSRQVKELHAWLVAQGHPTDPRELEENGQGYVEDFLEHCFYRQNKNVTRRTKLTAISKFFRYLVYKGIVSADITANIPRPRVKKKFMITFTRNEVYRMFTQLDITSEKGIRDCCVIILAVFCGLRIEEIITLDLDSISYDDQDLDILVKGKQYAGEHSRSVSLWKAPGFFIRQYFMIRLGHGAGSSDPFLVSHKHGVQKGRRLTQAAVDKMVKKLAVKAGISKPEIHMHMFRATHANDLQHIRGYIITAIMERMGWKDLSTAGRYLVRRERIHRIYDSLHQYWLDFGRIWTKAIPYDDKKQIEYKGDDHEISSSGGADGKE
jgi:site-specific recombinase XerD